MHREDEQRIQAAGHCGAAAVPDERGGGGKRPGADAGRQAEYAQIAG